MEIYLDTNATTPVLPVARTAALAAMAEDFGNPSSMHSTGLKAKALIDGVRTRARRVLGAPRGQLLFLSGATEGIQTAVLSALTALRAQRDAGSGPIPTLLLYGATEHKAVPEALKHWNSLLGLHLTISAIPVGQDGRHDLAWLRAQAPQAGLVCTMAANNETGVISDLDGIAQALAGSSALWLVDSVQALGKLPLELERRRIDYAPFSGHKLYAPKGIGLLYVREGAPFTPLLAGGGQEGALRSGTENMSGIAALGAVLAELERAEAEETDSSFQRAAVLAAYRDQLAEALHAAFPGLVFNAPLDLCLPTTLNFAVPGLSSRLLLDLFDAADVRVSGGSACSAAKAQPSFVLEAMGLPEWQTASAVRLSFGPAADAAFIAEACNRIRACGESLRDSCLSPEEGATEPADGVTRFAVDGACCYLLADATSKRCVVLDPLPELSARLAQWLRCQRYTLAAVLDTHSQGRHAESAASLRAAVPEWLDSAAAKPMIDGSGWPRDADHIALGARRLQRVPVEAAAGGESMVYLLQDDQGQRLAFVGDLAPAEVQSIGEALSPQTLLAPGHDRSNRLAGSVAAELNGDVAASEPAMARELDPAALRELLAGHPDALLVDVREPYEQRLSPSPELAGAARREAVPLSSLLNGLPRWLALPQTTPVVFFCRSGNRSAQAAQALRRLGHAQAWSLVGGRALWPQAGQPASPQEAHDDHELDAAFNI